MEVKELHAKTEGKELGSLLLDIGVSLLQAGASCSRIRTTMLKFASAFPYEPHIAIGHKSVSLSIHDKEGTIFFNGTRSASGHGIDFNSISQICKLSRVAEKKELAIHEIKKELSKARAPGQYSRIIILCFVSLAGASFCYTFGGSISEMSITFGATFCGLFLKQQLSKNSYNPYFCTYAAATVASFFVAVFQVAGLTVSPVNAFSTCVLFLIPGVMLINSFTDLMDSNTMNGIVKGVSALIHALAIALGLLTTLVIFNLEG